VLRLVRMGIAAFPAESARDIPDEAIRALIELAAACRIALDALPRLGQQTEDPPRPHIEALCDLTDRELKNWGVSTR
jgi:hypothetical protein